MFLDNIELRIENKNWSLGKTVLQFWSQICEQMAKLVHKMTLKKKRSKTKKIKKLKTWKRTFLSKSFYWPIKLLFHKSETTIAKQFFLNLNFCFLFLVRYCLETCVNRVANCVTQKFTTLRSEFLETQKRGRLKLLYVLNLKYFSE